MHKPLRFLVPCLVVLALAAAAVVGCSRSSGSHPRDAGTPSDGDVLGSGGQAGTSTDNPTSTGGAAGTGPAGGSGQAGASATGGGPGGTSAAVCDPFTDCDGVSVSDFATDPQHCGRCDVACNVAAGEACLHGQCVKDCGRLTNCDGACVDLASDFNHCGRCHSPVYPWVGDFCLEGDIRFSCGEKTQCGCRCVDLANDPRNCGGCGVACDVGKGEACLHGACVRDCGQLGNCDGACVDLQTDAHACGDCKSSCHTWAGEKCESGKCTCGSLSSCGRSCVNLQTDPKNCGACGVSCTPSTRCENGHCGQVGITCNGGQCPAGQGCCWNSYDGERCFDPAKDKCYGFEVTGCDGPEDCSPGELCCGSDSTKGVCAATCERGRVLCSQDADCAKTSAAPFCCDTGVVGMCNATRKCD